MFSTREHSKKHKESRKPKECCLRGAPKYYFFFFFFILPPKLYFNPNFHLKPDISVLRFSMYNLKKKVERSGEYHVPNCRHVYYSFECQQQLRAFFFFFSLSHKNLVA